MFPLLMLASHYVYWLSLSLSLLCFFCLFLSKKQIYLFGFLFKNCFSFVHPFLQISFLFYLLCCFAPFSHLFFLSCSFEQEKLTLFFFWQKNKLFYPSKNFFFRNSVISYSKKTFIVFFDFFLKSLFWKKLIFLKFCSKNLTKWLLQPTMFVPISFSDSLFVFRKISVCFLRKMFLIISFLCLLSFESFLEKIWFEKIVFLKKTKLLLYPLDFCSIFFWEQKLFSIFQLSFYFLCLSCYLLFLLFLFVFFWCLFFQMKKSCKKKLIRETFSFFFNIFLKKKTFFVRGNIFWPEKSVQKLSFEFSSKKKNHP